MVKLLLEDKSIAYIPDTNGQFPVHTAATMGEAGVIHMFMEICPNCDELLDNKGRNFLHCAVEHGRVMVVRQICRKPKFVRMLNARDGEGNTPLHLAVKHGYLLICLLLVANIRVKLSATNNEGLTPRDVATDEANRCYTFSAVICHIVHFSLLIIMLPISDHFYFWYSGQEATYRCA